MADIDERYDALDDVLKPLVSRKEFKWMDENQRTRLREEFTQPEPEADY